MEEKIKISPKDATEIAKADARVLVEILEYLPDAVVSKSIIKKLTGAVTVSSLDDGQGFAEKISPFDTFVQIIEGKAEVVINNKSRILKTGDGIVIPAHKSNSIKAEGRFKMISTVIKSGYESD